jgi:hypothetical protein
LGFFKEKQRVIPRTVAYGERMGALRPLLLKILFFFNTKPKKITFSGLFSYSNYLEENITLPPLPFKKKLIANDLRPPSSGPLGTPLVGGSIGFASPSKNFSFAYVMNRLDTKQTDIDPRITLIVNKIEAMLDNRN